MSILASIRGVFDGKSHPLVFARNSRNDSEGVGLSRKVRPDLDLAGSYVDYVDYLFVKISKFFSCPFCKGATPETSWLVGGLIRPWSR